MTSKQLDALQQYAEAVDAFIHAFAQDFPSIVESVEAQGELVKAWADSNPAPK